MHFSQHGYHVVGCSRGEGEYVSENYSHHRVDVSDEVQVRNWIRLVNRTYGRIDVLICNAGIAPASLLMLSTPGALLDNVMKTNISGTYYASRECGKVMMMQREGCIITLSSMSVGLHEEGTSAYSASKSAVVELTKIMAKELAEFGITCNVLAPSMYLTDSVAALGKDVAARALSKLTIKRTVRLSEICNVVSFLASPESKCITGQVIHMGLVP